MTALSAAANREFSNLHTAVTETYPVEAGETIYKGGLVMVDTDGYLKPASDLASHVVVGWADENIDNSSGADGALECRVISGCVGQMAASSVTQAMLDTPLMYVVDDNTVDETSPANSVKAGFMVRFISTTSVRLYIPPFGFTGARSA